VRKFPGGRFTCSLCPVSTSSPVALLQAKAIAGGGGSALAVLVESDRAWVFPVAQVGATSPHFGGVIPLV
jgi:hypothetical protein